MMDPTGLFTVLGSVAAAVSLALGFCWTGLGLGYRRSRAQEIAMATMWGFFFLGFVFQGPDVTPTWIRIGGVVSTGLALSLQIAGLRRFNRHRA